jgi:hypothetical protein
VFMTDWSDRKREVFFFAASGENLSGCMYVISCDDSRQNEPSYIIQAFVERMFGILGLQYISLELK